LCLIPSHETFPLSETIVLYGLFQDGELGVEEPQESQVPDGKFTPQKPPKKTSKVIKTCFFDILNGHRFLPERFSSVFQNRGSIK
jgi:hypothetical protein